MIREKKWPIQATWLEDAGTNLEVKADYAVTEVPSLLLACSSGWKYSVTKDRFLKFKSYFSFLCQHVASQWEVIWGIYVFQIKSALIL